LTIVNYILVSFWIRWIKITALFLLLGDYKLTLIVCQYNNLLAYFSSSFWYVRTNPITTIYWYVCLPI